MPYKDLHDEPFSESTIAKLEIFEDYAEAWIPTFVMSGSRNLAIFDFFAGSGYDKNGVAGSPIRILEKIKSFADIISHNNVRIVLHLNEFEPGKPKQNKFEMLRKACESFLKENSSLHSFLDIKFYNENFESLFPKLLPEINVNPSLVYLDQNGIRFASGEYLLELEKSRQTDFLYFISSSYFWRFGDREEFAKYLPVDISEARKKPYEFIHRYIIGLLRDLLPQNTRLKLHPFTLKKGANIYGIVFGASHPRAVQKFLNIVWKRNGLNGEANFDIDDDTSKAQGSLFDAPKLTKIEIFQNNVENKVLNGEIRNNFELFAYTLEEGHLGSHASNALRSMKSKGLIYFEGISPLVTYENVYTKQRKLEYIVKHDEKK